MILLRAKPNSLTATSYGHRKRSRMSSVLLWFCLLANLACAEVSASLSNQRKQSISREDLLQCYSLPYGVIGFVSHVITLYTLICLWHRRRPSNPWKTLGNPLQLVRIIGMVTMVATLTLAAFTIVRCSNGMGLLVIQSVLNASVSALLGCTTCSAGFRINEPDPSSPALNDTNPPESQTFDMDLKNLSSFVSSVLPTENSPVPPSDSVESQTISRQSKPKTLSSYVVWILLYFPFSIAGLVGIAILVNGNWDNHAVQLVTVAVVSVAVCWSMFWISAAIFAVSKDPQKKILPLLCGVILVCVGISVMIVSPFYSDWVLGAVGNFAGLPIGRNAGDLVVYWGYFIANFFPLACI